VRISESAKERQQSRLQPGAGAVFQMDAVIGAYSYPIKLSLIMSIWTDHCKEVDNLYVLWVVGRHLAKEVVKAAAARGIVFRPPATVGPFMP